MIYINKKVILLCNDQFKYIIINRRSFVSNTMLYSRIGMGLDFHKIKKSEPTIIKICGVDIASDFVIEAHSDGDVGLHALTEAMLGAIANGNIGTHFKNTDPQWRNASSSVFVEYANLSLIHI